MSPVTKWTISIIAWLIFIGLTIVAIFQQTSGGASGVVLSMVFSLVGIVVGMIPIFLPDTIKDAAST
jgi:magnesium-transporting ATPase (P-type)